MVAGSNINLAEDTERFDGCTEDDGAKRSDQTGR